MSVTLKDIFKKERRIGSAKNHKM